MRPKAPGDRYAVAHCVPPVLPAYAKLFHPIYEDVLIKDLELTWKEADAQARPSVTGPFKTLAEETLHEALCGATLVYGGAEPGGKLSQVRWVELARRVGGGGKLATVPDRSRRGQPCWRGTGRACLGPSAPYGGRLLPFFTFECLQRPIGAAAISCSRACWAKRRYLQAISRAPTSRRPTGSPEAGSGLSTRITTGWPNHGASGTFGVASDAIHSDLIRCIVPW